MDLHKIKNNRGLEKVIAKVNALNAEDYTADSWAAVQSALAAAKAVAADQNATRTQINAAMEELVASILQIRVWRTETSSGSCSRRSRKDPGTSGKL